MIVEARPSFSQSTDLALTFQTSASLGQKFPTFQNDRKTAHHGIPPTYLGDTDPYISGNMFGALIYKYSVLSDVLQHLPRTS
eukprot:5647686-Amphidinium_carterae.1